MMIKPITTSTRIPTTIATVTAALSPRTVLPPAATASAATGLGFEYTYPLEVRTEQI